MSDFITILQITFMLVMIMSLLNNGKGERSKKNSFEQNARIMGAELGKLNAISLTEPLSEKTRPAAISEIKGQEEGIRGLLTALCGRNPQHIIIYGPPGVGKTCAARLALEEAKRSKGTPFRKDAPFVEIDATCVRFDERSIADPLIGSVHDPIYQGAGAYGAAGVPQPKPGAVTKAHGGVLFLDEIGELHPMQMNKLLKVMEDRRVFLESAYYNKCDDAIPQYIHDVFKKGLPADFRLIGATTRRPEELPMAIRSRCIEIFFNALEEDELRQIAGNAVSACDMEIDDCAVNMIAEYSAGGRDAVNIAQMAIGKCYSEERTTICREDIEWIIGCGRYSRHGSIVCTQGTQVGAVNALGVTAGNTGYVFQIECCVIPNGTGKIILSGFAESEEARSDSRSYRRKSSAAGSVNNALAVLRKQYDVDTDSFDFHLDAVGGMMVDGPSAGIAILVCMYSAVTGREIPGEIALTGEIGLNGSVRAVGGVRLKTDAAAKAGIRKVLIPKDNDGEASPLTEECVCVGHISQVMDEVFGLREASAADFAEEFAPAAG